MANSITLQSQQNQKVLQALNEGKTVAFNVNPCPGGGFVWPHITSNGVPIAFMTPRQVKASLDAIGAGKTLSASFNSGLGKHQLDFN